MTDCETRAHEDNPSQAATRPILFGGAFFVLAAILGVIDFSFNVSAIWGTNPLAYYVFHEIQFCLRIAFTFWLSFRLGSAKSIERAATWSLFLGWIAMEEMSNPWFDPYYGYQTWAGIYRILLFLLVFRLLQQGLGLSIQPNGLQRPVKKLKMLTLLTCMAMFAMLFVADSAIRGRFTMQYQVNLQSDPPLLALVASVTRATLWLGVALLMSNRPRSSFLPGIGMILLWVISRTCVIIYLVNVLYPSQQDTRFAGTRFLEWETLVVLQVVQLLFVGVSVLSIRLAGYRFNLGMQDSIQKPQVSVKFDDLQ